MSDVVNSMGGERGADDWPVTAIVASFSTFNPLPLRHSLFFLTIQQIFLNFPGQSSPSTPSLINFQRFRRNSIPPFWMFLSISYICLLTSDSRRALRLWTEQTGNRFYFLLWSLGFGDFRVLPVFVLVYALRTWILNLGLHSKCLWTVFTRFEQYPSL